MNADDSLTRVEELYARLQAARAKLETTPGIRCIADDFVGRPGVADYDPLRLVLDTREDRKSTRLNSSHFVPSRMPSSA